MEFREARGGTRTRIAALTALGVVLIAAPVFLGLRMAQAGAITYRTDERPAVVITTPGDVPTDLPAVVDSTDGQEPVTIEDALTPRPTEETESRITWLRPDAMPIPVRNGGSIALGDDLEVTITADPYPPDNFDPASVEFALTWNGQPVEGATMTAQYDMRLMLHGPFPVDLGTGADGTFLFTYQPFMFGPWQIDATVMLPGSSDPISFSISIYVWPST